MSDVLVIEGWIANLRGDFPQGALNYIDPEEAHAKLVEVAGKDLRRSHHEWVRWYRREGRTLELKDVPKRKWGPNAVEELRRELWEFKRKQRQSRWRT